MNTLRYDERDNVFARRDLQHGSPEFEEFYARHPEWIEADAGWRSRPELGSGIHPSDMGFYESPASLMWELGQPHIVDGTSTRPRAELTPAQATLKIKIFAKRLGADLVGISPLKPEYVFSHRGRIKYPEEPWGSEIVCHHGYAISMGFREDVNLIETAPRPAELFESSLVYLRSATASVVLAHYIRSLGYPARAHHFRNYQVLCVPLAVESGLGELARCGFLLTKEHGNCLRLSTVTTDLPLDMDGPIDIGVQDFCDRCKLCAQACPSKAIPFGEKIELRGIKRWSLNELNCYHYWTKIGTDCGICIASCPLLWVRE